MRHTGPLFLLTLGVVMAGLFGARNGDHFAAYRADQAAGVESKLPDPSQRLQGWWDVGGIGWGTGIGLIVLGAALARRRQHEDATTTTDGEIAVEMGQGLKQVLDATDAIAKQIAELPMDTDAPAARDALDALSFEVIGPLVDARARFAARHGLSVFTEYFGPFSAGERQLARAWSAITDGHSVVARESLGQAHVSFTQALEAWDRAEGS
jgi:hypothetical protein